MRKLHLEAAEDHVQRLARESDALGAVKELIWNALDADATKVDLEVDADEIAMRSITVRDNGRGFPHARAEELFAQAEELLRAGDLGGYQETIRLAEDKVNEAIDALEG